MKNIKSFLFPFITILFSVLFFSCTKDNIITPNQQVALFASSSASYFITNDPNTEFKIPFGVTQVANKDLKIEFSVTSPSGAVEGQQYTLSGNTAIIPAGSTIDSLSLKGIFAAYPSGRKDTLIFKITGGDIPSLIGSDVYTLVLQKYCDVDINSFVGAYTQCFDDASYGPYEIDVLSATSTGPTTGYLMIANLWDAGGSTPIQVNLDWTDAAHFTTFIPTAQPLYIDSQYGQALVRPNSTGIFSSCDNAFTLNYQVYVSAGNFPATSTTMGR